MVAIPGFLKFKACCVFSPKLGVIVAAGVSFLLSIFAWIVVGTVPAQPWAPGVTSSGTKQFYGFAGPNIGANGTGPDGIKDEDFFGDTKYHQWDRRVGVAITTAVFPLLAFLFTALAIFFHPRKILSFIAAALQGLAGIWAFAAFIVYCNYVHDCKEIEGGAIKDEKDSADSSNYDNVDTLHDYCYSNAIWGLITCLLMFPLCLHFVCVLFLWAESDTTGVEKKDTGTESDTTGVEKKDTGTELA